MKKTAILATVSAALFSGSLMAQTVVTVNGAKIDSSELDRRVAMVYQSSKGQVGDSPELRQALLGEAVEELVVSQEARRLGLDKSSGYKTAHSDALKQVKQQGDDKRPDFKEQWAIFENGLLARFYAEDVLQKNPVTEEQVQQRYELVKKQKDGVEEIQLGEIVTDSAKQAQAAIRDLGAKKKFADVAKKYGIQPVVKAGQVPMLEFVAMPQLEQMNSKVFQAVQNLKKGQFTKTPLTDGKVYVVFYVNEKRAIEVPAFEAVRKQVQQQLEIERVQQAVGGLLEKAEIVEAK